jgi:hypothetical protein
MADAVAAFRSKGITDAAGNVLSFIGEGSGFDVQPTEVSNWTTRGVLSALALSSMSDISSGGVTGRSRGLQDAQYRHGGAEDM